MTKVKTKKIQYLICSFLSALILINVIAPCNANAYNTDEVVFKNKTGYLYDYNQVKFDFTVSKQSEMTYYFTYYTEGAYYVSIVNSQGNEVKGFYEHGSAERDFILSKGSYSFVIKETEGEKLYYDFSLLRAYNKTIKTKKVKLNRKRIKINLADAYTLKATVTPKDSTQKGKWMSSNKKVATVYEDGTLSPQNYGKATITYQHGSKKAKCKVTVNSGYIEMGKGKTKELKKRFRYVKGYKKAKWSSTNPSKVSVSNSGKIYTKSGGQATIKAKIKGTTYKVWILSYDKDILKKKTKAALLDWLYVPSSLKIQTVRFPNFYTCRIYYSAKNRLGNRRYGVYEGYYWRGSFFSNQIN